MAITRADKKRDLVNLLNQIHLLDGIPEKECRDANILAVENFFRFSKDKQNKILSEYRQLAARTLSTKGSKYTELCNKVEEDET